MVRVRHRLVTADSVSVLVAGLLHFRCATTTTAAMAMAISFPLCRLKLKMKMKAHKGGDEDKRLQFVFVPDADTNQAK